MPTEAIIAGLVSIIGTLSGAVALLWREHKAADQRERERGDALQKRVDDFIDIFKRARPRS